MSTGTDALLCALERQLDGASVLKAEDVGGSYWNDATDGRGRAPTLVLRPRDTAQLSAILAACNALKQPVVVQGGRTGLSGAARPQRGEISISMERMSAIAPVDRAAATVIAEAGAPLERVQEAAADARLFFGVDIGARGTATIGGNIATNAGGIRVLRYGMFRTQVLGVEAVLADGTILSALKGLAKDNSGYDLSQVFIGAEGTLGVITRACLRLHPQPKTQVNALIALPEARDAIRLLERLRAEVGANLSAFELIMPPVYEGVIGFTGQHPPVRIGAGAYAVIEVQGQDSEHDEDNFAAAMMRAMDDDLIADAVLSQSLSDFNAIWKLRENCSAFIFTLQDVLGFDVSVPIKAMDAFLHSASKRMSDIDRSAEIYCFGHLGDGNLHYLVRSGAKAAVSQAIYEAVTDAGGSISAEHGIGLDKKQWLSLSRSAAEIAAMRRLKSAFDPHNILNRGRIFDLPGQGMHGNVALE